MDFKKDWAKLTVAGLAGLMGLFFLIAIFTETETLFSMMFGLEAAMGGEELALTFTGLNILEMPEVGFTMFTLLYLLPTIFFLGLSVYTVLKVLKIDIAKYVILGVGALNTLLFLIALIVAPEIQIAFGQIQLMMYWIPLVIFGLFPLVKGVKKTFCTEE